jgi:secreted trypsin-like serine protease
MRRDRLGATVVAAAVAAATVASPAAAISDGSNAFEGDRSLVPAVVRIDASGPSSHCSGTLIAPRWVLTAQHCTYRHESPTDPYDAGNLAVKVNKSATNDARTVQVAGVSRLEGFTDDLVNDVALLELDSEVTDVTPVRVADAGLPEGVKGYLYGFGPTHRGGFREWVKQRATFSSADEPTKMPRLAELEVARPACDLPAELMYVRSVRGRSVDGDSGGPLLEWDNGVPTLFAVNAGSFDRVCESGDWAGVLNPVDRQSAAWQRLISRHVPELGAAG